MMSILDNILNGDIAICTRTRKESDKLREWFVSKGYSCWLSGASISGKCLYSHYKQYTCYRIVCGKLAVSSLQRYMDYGIEIIQYSDIISWET